MNLDFLANFNTQYCMSLMFGQMQRTGNVTGTKGGSNGFQNVMSSKTSKVTAGKNDTAGQAKLAQTANQRRHDKFLQIVENSSFKPSAAPQTKYSDQFAMDNLNDYYKRSILSMMLGNYGIGF